ncbi:MAG: N-formylglutamate amidohydrolase, partial [Bdellovibrionales bacterium]|nr:N-formylglutamate amidohydrolase [Bdellovibrionales bacterium]
MRAFLISVPHSGEKVPEEVSWLKGLPESHLMCDVDRFVDKLYQPVVEDLDITWILAEWHRYVVDLNRLPEDVDQSTVLGVKHLPGEFTRGFHWRETTTGQKLMNEPISQELHEQLARKYFWPFHKNIESVYEQFRSEGAKNIFHIDAHSMPSQGTQAHRDPGQQRADIVISDVNGKSCDVWFRDLVLHCYAKAGFQTSLNWPYMGGRLTQTYGRPDIGQNVIQVEINRSLYMDENTKKLKEENLADIQ